MSFVSSVANVANVAKTSKALPREIINYNLISL
jgi:hypothetical protein